MKIHRDDVISRRVRITAREDKCLLKHGVRERESLQQPGRIYHLCPPQSNSELVSFFSNPFQPESFQ